jgi:peptide/nickel transport system permease protein
MAQPNPAGKAIGRDVGAMTQWELIRMRFCRHRLAVASFLFLCVLYTVAIFSEFFRPQDPNLRNVEYAYCPPQLVRWTPREGLHVRGLRQAVDPVTFRRSYAEDPAVVVPLAWLTPGTPYRLCGLIPLRRCLLGIDRAAWSARYGDALVATHDAPLGRVDGIEPTFFLLGADAYGRDGFSRILSGARISLSVGLIGVAFTFLLGMTIGGISGYASGWTDMLLQRLVEIVGSFPQLPLWLALAAVMPSDWSALKVYFGITVLLSLLNWTGLARVVRGKILSLREEDYATAARLLGASHARILFRHLIPGFTSHIIVALTLGIPGMILGETGLSFLGLGLRPPVVSWGVMLQSCMDVKAVQFYPWLLMPVFFITATVLSFNFMGDGMRDAADPYASNG